MAVWRMPSAIRASPQAPKEAQMNCITLQADVKEDNLILSGQYNLKFVAERTPEQTALIALRGLLEAKETYIQRLEADAKGAELRSAQQMKALRHTCHAKIQGIQKTNAAQVETLKQSHEATLQESATQACDLNHNLTAALRKASALEMRLCKAESSCKKAQEDAQELRGELVNSNSAAESACSRAQQAEMDCMQLRQALQQQSCASRTAIAELDSRIADMARSTAAQQDEIATLHATIQGQCLERIRLQTQLSQVHATVPQSTTRALEDLFPPVAAAAHQSTSTVRGTLDTEMCQPQPVMPAYVIQRRASSVRGGVYAGMRPGQSRQWQK